MAFNTRLLSVAAPSGQPFLLRVQDRATEEPTEISCKWVINCAGLHAGKVAECVDAMPRDLIPRIHYAKGNYFSLSAKPPFSRLVYPGEGDQTQLLNCTYGVTTCPVSSTAAILQSETCQTSCS